MNFMSGNKFGGPLYNKEIAWSVTIQKFTNESCKITSGIAKNKTDTFLIAIKKPILTSGHCTKLPCLYSCVSLSIALPDSLILLDCKFWN